jgi:N-dimethylarginine dimethylaminohydrolase
MTSRFLMCEPQYFDVNYVINPWMTDNLHRVGYAEARAQWASLNGLIQNEADVELIDPKPGLPDMPFTANAGLVVGNRVVLSNFRHPERQTEEPHFERWFHDHGFSVDRLPRNLSFEGAGDALLDRGRSLVWMGYGHRSEREAGPYIQKLLGLDVVMLELTDPRFYHLDTCFCPLAGGKVLYYPLAFTPVALRSIHAHVAPEDRIEATDEDANAFCVNAVNIGAHVIMTKAPRKLRRRLERAGFSLDEVDLAPFILSGGGAYCMTLRLDRVSAPARVAAAAEATS